LKLGSFFASGARRPAEAPATDSRNAVGERANPIVPPAQASRPVIASLQAGRAAAALAVVGHHAGATVSTYVGPLPAIIESVLTRGYLGVDFFFVLSGFIIAHVNLGHDPNSGWRRHYVRSRLTRIFIPYLPVGIALALAYTAFPALSNSNRQWGWYETLTLMPGTLDPALLVAWTLQHEMIFYALFLVFALTRHAFVAATLWAVAIILFNLLIGAPERPLQPVLGMINVEFVLGMFAARLVRHPWFVPALFVAGGAAAFTGFVATGALPEQRVLFGLAMALWLVPIVEAEGSGQFTVPRTLVFLGGASYAIYLVHSPVLALLGRIAPSTQGIALLFFLIAGTAAGIAYHMLVERPGLALVKRATRRA
jgi:exopolysaccharide production protein ExoZ